MHKKVDQLTNEVAMAKLGYKKYVTSFNKVSLHA